MKAVLLVLLGSATAYAGPHVDVNGVLIRDARSCGTTTVAHPVAAAALFSQPATTTRTIFLNKNGGVYNITNGMTDASMNTANVIATGDNHTHANITIPPIDAVFNWPYIVACVKTQYKPYNIVITETEPTSGNYVEAVVGGDGSTNGFTPQDGILGVASADNFCGVTEKGIAFSFAHNHVGITKQDDELCATIAHEVGHLLALEHEAAAPDTMSYVPFAASHVKSFTTPSSHCGIDDQDPSSCSCDTVGGANMTSSGVRLTQFIGLRPTETVPPTLDVSAPGDDVKLPPSFSVVATATDDTAMDQVAVLLNGTNIGASTTPAGTTYTVPLTNVPEGNYTLEVQAIDLAGNITKKDLAVTVALGATGDACVNNTDCHGSICAQNDDGTAFCTQTCDDANTCPDNFACQLIGAQNICVPSGGGGCAIGGGDQRTLIALLGLSLALVLRRRRR